MIRRARPKFFRSDFLNKIKESSSNEMFFDSGTSGIFFVIKYLQKKFSCKLKVCMQSFNCITVYEAVNKLGCDIMLSDIKKSDFSISFEFLQKNIRNIDILILLHYQGKINEEYQKIISLCNSNGVIVIEDLAHVAESDHILKGDFGVYSYSFDKPFSCLHGGKVVVNKLNQALIEEYSKLSRESKMKEYIDLRVFEFLYFYSDKKFYSKSIDKELVVRFFMYMHINEKIIFLLLSSKKSNFFVKVINFLASKLFNRKLNPKKLGRKKIGLVTCQALFYFENKESLRQKERSYINQVLGFNLLNTRWNRLSLLPNEYKNLAINNNEIEYGNFNWPNPLHLACNMNVINKNDCFENTEYVVSNIINIPIWQYIYETESSI